MHLLKKRKKKRKTILVFCVEISFVLLKVTALTHGDPIDWVNDPI